MLAIRSSGYFAAVVFMTVILGTVACAQDYESAAESAVEYQRFPWQKSGELTELDRDDPGQAASANRDAIPRRVTSTTNWPNFSLPGGWFTFFNGLIWVIIIVLIAAVAAVLIYMYLKVDKEVSGNASFEDYDQEEMIAERIKQLPFELNRNQPGNLSEQARDLAQQGDYSRAMMFLFSHVLLSLDKNELIRLKRGKTNRQYLNELRRYRNICDYYRKVMVPFEDAFFGDYEISKTRFENCWSELHQFESSVDSTQQVTAP